MLSVVMANIITLSVVATSAVYKSFSASWIVLTHHLRPDKSYSSKNSAYIVKVVKLWKKNFFFLKAIGNQGTGEICTF